jgi:hypothetical protein
MANYKIKIVGTDDYVIMSSFGAYCAGDDKSFIWENEDDAKKAMETCEKYWGKMELIAA